MQARLGIRLAGAGVLPIFEPERESPDVPANGQSIVEDLQSLTRHVDAADIDGSSGNDEGVGNRPAVALRALRGGVVLETLPRGLLVRGLRDEEHPVVPSDRVGRLE